MPDDAFTIDTSSVIQVRRIVVRDHQSTVFSKLTELVVAGKLFYPKEVPPELDRHSNQDSSVQDLPRDWAKLNSSIATHHAVPFETVKAVLAQVPEILDPEKSGVEEADPYVLALAIHLQEQGKQVTVLTEERKDRPDKMSLTTACGVLRLPCLPMMTFLKRNGIWQPS